VKTRWVIKNHKEDIAKLAALSGMSETICHILVNRGIKTPEGIVKFINPSLKDLANPLMMKDLQKGISIISNAIKNNKKIVVYGDYDV
jgi:single-stranded-DNA-specific exonuclease